METNKKNNSELLRKNLGLFLGITLLIPPIFSVVSFLLQLSGKYPLREFNSDYVWNGDTTALPFYFGLMAIAGAYLIKDTKKE